MGLVAVSRKPDPELVGPRRNRPGVDRLRTCRYLQGRGNQATRCSAEPVTDPDADSLELCSRHLGLAVSAFRRIAAEIDRVENT